MDRNALPVIDSCDDCGACCMHVAVPLGFGLFLRKGVTAGQAIEMSGREEYERWHSAPEEAKRLLREAHYRGGGRLEEPCCWLDMETRRCRFYDHRPQVCRDFRKDTIHCHRFRQQHGVDP